MVLDYTALLFVTLVFAVIVAGVAYIIRASTIAVEEADQLAKRLRIGQDAERSSSKKPSGASSNPDLRRQDL